MTIMALAEADQSGSRGVSDEAIVSLVAEYRRRAYLNGEVTEAPALPIGPEIPFLKWQEPWIGEETGGE